MHTEALYKPRCRTTARKTFFLEQNNRRMDQNQTATVYVIDSSSVNVFKKNRLDESDHGMGIYSGKATCLPRSSTTAFYKYTYCTSTRKLCYRKDDRAMRPVDGCPENFLDPWLRPGLLFSTFSCFFLKFCSYKIWSPYYSFTRSRQFDIIGGTPKIRAVPGYVHARYYAKFLMGFYSDWPCKCTRQIWSPWL